MGRGNWFPSTGADDSPRPLVYVQLHDFFEDGDEHEQQRCVSDAYRCFVECVHDALPPSFDCFNPWNLDSWAGMARNQSFNSDDGILAANGHAAIVWDTQGDFWHQGLAVIAPQRAFESRHLRLSEQYVERFAAKLFPYLAKLYPGGLSVRCCGYTSAPYGGAL